MTHAVLVGVILIAVALVLAAASSRSLLGHWLGLRVGAPRDRVAEVLTIHEQREKTIRDAIHAEAERLWPDGPDDQPWPSQPCTNPPCSPEDGWDCDWHRPHGRHHPAATHIPPHTYIKWDHCDRCFATFLLFSNEPRYDAPPAVAEPNYDEWVETWNRKYAE